MKLVIKLDDETYKEVMDRTEFDTLVLGIKLIEAVQNATPLPKGHGRLLDEDMLLSMLVYGKHIDDCKCGEIAEVCNKAVVIEADKENK